LEKISEYSTQTIIEHKNKLTPNEKWTFGVNGANALPLLHGKETNIIAVVGIRRKREYEGIYYTICKAISISTQVKQVKESLEQNWNKIKVVGTKYIPKET